MKRGKAKAKPVKQKPSDRRAPNKSIETSEGHRGRFERLLDDAVLSGRAAK